MVISLDCLGKLISYNYLVDVDADAGVRSSSGENSDTTATSHAFALMETVVDVICDSFVGENTDEKVQLQIIKALLAAVLSSSTPIHQSSLLKAVRTCYNIFLLSRNPANQTIAQATLTQMVHQVFGRVKVGARPTRSPAGSESSASLTSSAQKVAGSAVAAELATELTVVVEERKSLEEKIVEEFNAARQEAAEENGQEGAVEDFVDTMQQAFTDEAADSASSLKSPKSPRSLKSPRLPISATSLNGTEEDADEDFGKTQQVAEVEESFESVEVTHVNGNGGESSNTDRRESVKTLVATGATEPKNQSDPLTLKSFENRKSFDNATLERMEYDTQADLYVKDAFLVLRALCKLSMKPISMEGTADLKSYSMRSKLLSLHLVLTILTSHLQVFTSPFVVLTSTGSPDGPPQGGIQSTPFIQAVKQYLCLSLSRNAVSVVPQVFDISLEIFWKVMQGLRMFLKVRRILSAYLKCLYLASNSFMHLQFDLCTITCGTISVDQKEIEVFFNEIFLPILEMRTASFQQKHSLLKVVLRICSDPQTLVEMYLNYDCDKEALDNIYERFVYTFLVNVLSKITTTYTAMPTTKEATDSGSNPSSTASSPYSSSTVNTSDTSLTSVASSIVVIPPSLTTDSVLTTDRHTTSSHPPTEFALKAKSLECLVSVLRSLVAWYNKGAVSLPTNSGDVEDSVVSGTPRDSEDFANLNNGGVHEQLTTHSNSSNHHFSPSSSTYSVVTGTDSRSAGLDDPEQFENLKHRKQMLQEGIRKFNWKPKKGIQYLLSGGFIKSMEPIDVAKFLLTTEGLSKAMIGEYLGEGEQENVSIMHAFVDQMVFLDMKFTDALRQFLQSFRLPGEAQKIDRFMLKFAERYVNGNPAAFANAGKVYLDRLLRHTAYVLAYSVIMLNTDLHNRQVKKRMTKSEFIKNNRGINDNADLPEELLESIYDEINENEIKMKDEVEAAAGATIISNSSGLGPLGQLNIASLQNALVSVGLGRDTKRDAQQAVTEEMGSKTEALFKSMLRSKNRRGAATVNSITFYSASHIEHVRPMFEVAWMAFLAGISGPLQESDDSDTVNLCLEGFKLAIRVICLFHMVQSEDMDLQRDAFVTTLTKFTFLSNLGEMKFKNIEAIKTLLDIASSADGSYLKGSWKEVLTCVSQLERFQLITNGLDQGVVPDVWSTRRQAGQKNSLESVRRQPTIISNKRPSRQNTQTFAEDVASASNSHQVILIVDKLFTSTVNLTGPAIVDFVRALCEVSWEEITSSALLEHPRMFSLQKLVEISYYNMGRIRLEWSNVWAHLGEHFNIVGCQPNFNIAFFALDSLRQLSMKFLEKEELAHFKFQKDFLMPFEHILGHNPDVAIKDMVLRCLSQMIQARSHNIKSGWRTMFGVFSKAARETHGIVLAVFRNRLFYCLSEAH
ncbi:hypothetical protein BC936DRAFT_143684 [Jimgerdemannia flammicorona]|uniref:SEC7 domain-containing protein n=1 Tax=Jimgerdemannia flammicorona TaxID=994334 RepID=A0A433DNE7_9FUNG|nr:hypothetical protein BC936DRAFT_143684 [Jimgerdemannia flammicorona]